MNVTALQLAGLFLIESTVHRDHRGFLVERFKEDRFSEFGLPTTFVQDIHVRSVPRVLRGLHFQTSPGQGKLVSVARGRIWDVAVDIRASSPTFGHYLSVELNDENGKTLWIPNGFAHGYCVLDKEAADVIYRFDSLYSPGSESGIHFADPDLSIAWPIETPILSSRDSAFRTLAGGALSTGPGR